MHAGQPFLRSGPASRSVFGALDLGTNNCRLLIARRSHGDDGEFQVIDAYSRIVRLGEGLLQSGRLSDAAMDRAVAALSACADKLARRGVTQVRSVATEACRRAVNGPEFVRRVYEETGLALDVITPAEEARLAVLGCQTLIDRTARRTLVFDIGGGSTEVVLLERTRGDKPRAPAFRMEAWVSVPWGVVSLGETELADAGDPALRMEAYERMKARVAEHLKPLVNRMRGDVQLLGASGTVTTLASLNMGLPQYDRRQVDGSLASTTELVALSHGLARKSPEERAAIPGVGTDRADLVVAGAAILEALIDLGSAPRLRVADRGIREGILRSMIVRTDAAVAVRA
ncbi:Ppx/GppA family phosphatase [Sandaracinobacter sp. RS1-74]|nr:Ppx/GppA phosphatase family protein [Sandaracinobacteroides sayramensis]MCG2839732.1 Ppx/GppA family phosphatase [Sandaracinobacteroides sayramensis]